jgi:CysZ protein
MTSVIKAMSLALGQIGDPAFRKVMAVGVVGALVVFIALWFLASWGVGLVPWSDLPLIGWMFDWMGSILEWLGEWFTFLGDVAFGAVMLTVIFLLFPAVTTTIVSLFLDEIIGAVEDKHYPGRGEPRSQPLPEMIGQSLKFLAIVVGVNILALPIYAILLFLPPLNLVFYYLLNGYLVGREFYEMVSIRRMTPQDAIVLRKRFGGRVVLAGAIIVFCMTVPVLNLLIPVLAAATMVHIFESMRQKAAAVPANP